MSYVDRHLAPDEQVVFRTRLHWVVFASAVGWGAFVLLVAGLIVAHNELAPETVRLVWLGAAAIVVAGFVSPGLRWRTSEFAVTTTRVVIRVGLVSAHTVELPNAKVGAIAVDQTIWGRLLGYGTLHVAGPGGTAETFQRVARPYELRDAVPRQAPRSPAARRS